MQQLLPRIWQLLKESLTVKRRFWIFLFSSIFQFLTSLDQTILRWWSCKSWYVHDVFAGRIFDVFCQPCRLFFHFTDPFTTGLISPHQGGEVWDSVAQRLSTSPDTSQAPSGFRLYARTFAAGTLSANEAQQLTEANGLRQKLQLRSWLAIGDWMEPMIFTVQSLQSFLFDYIVEYILSINHHDN